MTRSVDPDLGIRLAFLYLPLLVWTGIALRELRRARATMAWSMTTGRILEAAELPPVRVYRTMLPSSVARIRYKYAVNGEDFTGSAIGGSDGEDSYLESSKELLHQYPRGRDVRVYYDPLAPGHAVLRRGAGFLHWSAVLLPVIGLVGSSVYLWFRLRAT